MDKGKAAVLLVLLPLTSLGFAPQRTDSQSESQSRNTFIEVKGQPEHIPPVSNSLRQVTNTEFQVAGVAEEEVVELLVPSTCV